MKNLLKKLKESGKKNITIGSINKKFPSPHKSFLYGTKDERNSKFKLVAQ